MKPEIIWSDFVGSMKGWARSPGTVFWTLAFPILLMVLFGAIFEGQEDFSLTLYVQDQDDTNTSAMFIESLELTLDIEMIPTDKNADDYIKEKDLRTVLFIPDGFENAIVASKMGIPTNTNVTLKLDPLQESTNGVIRGVVGGTLQAWNNDISNTSNVLGYQEQGISAKELKFIDFFMPGVIGLSVMSSSIYGTIFRNTKYRNDGILRKLATTPMTHAEYLFSKMLFMTFLSFISTFVIILVGVLAFDIQVAINIFSIVIIVAASFSFAGIGLIVTRFVKEEETADSAGGAITFPQMFLAGTFFPLETMPAYLSTIAKVLPLYYVNQGLRDAMINENMSGALFNTGVTLALAFVFFIIGAVLTKWKED
jgi:ABC-2 type transport system permease protein